jgi:hypothetical protein
MTQSGEFSTPPEFGLVGMGIGGGFSNTEELHVPTYEQAMKSSKHREWKPVAQHDRMVQHGVFIPVPISDIPADAKRISTWAMRQKADGTKRARLAEGGFKQIPGFHFDPDTRSSPVVCDATMRTLFVLSIMAGNPIHVIDVRAAFLNGEFEDGETIYMVVPLGFEQYYDPKTTILLLVRTLYGLVQAAIAFWHKLVLAFAKIGFKRSKADPCVFCNWTKAGIVIWMVVVDDCCGMGPESELLESKKQLMEIFDCDDQGPMREYIGCKVDYGYEKKHRCMKITQPVLVQSLSDEFELNMDNLVVTPGVPGQVLQKGEVETSLGEQFQYRKETGKLFHQQKWSRPDILNATRDLSRFMGNPTTTHVKALHRIMTYVVQTPARGLLLSPNDEWDGTAKNLLFWEDVMRVFVHVLILVAAFRDGVFL